MKRERISKHQSDRIGQLESRLGSKTIRTILSGESNRIMSPDRYAKIMGGTAKLTDVEKTRIELLSANAPQINQYKGRSLTLGHSEVETNRALKNWLVYGKQRDAARHEDKEKELRAIRALRQFGFQGSLKGKGYVRKVV